MKNIVLLLCSLLVFVGCSAEQNEETTQTEANSDSNVKNELPARVVVNIQTTPEELTPGKPVTLQAHVTQGNENVTDADEVVFEVWKKGQKEHEKIPAEHQEDGLYSIEKTFKEDGIYFVIAHVSARDMHVMPQQELIVGEVNIEDLNQETEENNKVEIDINHSNQGTH